MMKRKIASIGFQDNGIVLEGLSKEGQQFEDIVLCCQYLLQQSFNGDFIENEMSNKYRKQINLYEEKKLNGENLYFWEFLNQLQPCNPEVFNLNNLERLLINVLRNHIPGEKLSENVKDKFLKNIKIIESDNSVCSELIEQKILALLKDLLSDKT